MPTERVTTGSSQNAALSSERKVNVIGPQLVIPQLVVGTVADLVRLGDIKPGTFTQFGLYEADGHYFPDGALKPLARVSQHMEDQAVLINSGTYRLPQERARLTQELWTRREKYFQIVDGDNGDNSDRQIDLQHDDLQKLRNYSNEILDGRRERAGGELYGLRVRASERNKDSEEMMALTNMPLRELIAYTKEHRPIHLKPGTSELLLPRDYPKATADTAQWGEALFYHDAPVLVDGILASDIPDRVEYAKGTVEALIYELYLLDGHIANGTKLNLLKNSQDPSLTRMVSTVYDEMIKDGYDQDEADDWLSLGMDAAEFEYTSYWKNPHNNHHVEGSTLITPGDADVGALAEYETGMDTTAEYHNRAHDYQATHINGSLVRYAWDIANHKRKIGDQEAAEKYQQEGDAMAQELLTLYDDRIFRDRDARGTGLLNPVMSLNGYKLLRYGIPLPEQARTMANELYKFRGPYGLAHLVPESVPHLPNESVLSAFEPHTRRTVRAIRGPRQWGDGENNNTGWAVDVDAVIDGFIQYGHVDLAINLAEEALLAAAEDLQNYGTEFEKRDVLTGLNGQGVEYPRQIDFGWSIALPLKIMKKLPELYAKRSELKRNADDQKDKTAVQKDVTVFEALA
jgi:hypothetical protein